MGHCKGESFCNVPFLDFQGDFAYNIAYSCPTEVITVENMLVYHPMHMHLHAACDHGASMAMYMYNAQMLGMRYIWFTDHDTRTGLKKHPVTGFTFDAPELCKEESTGGYHGFRPVDDAISYSVDPQNKQLTLRFVSENGDAWQGSGIFFASSGTRHTAPLAAGVTLALEKLDFTPTADSRLIVDITLSQRPPECEKAHLLYVLGSTEGLEGVHTQIIPLENRGGKRIFPISEDVSEDSRIGGRDNAFDTVTVRLEARKGAGAVAILGDFQICVEKHYEQAHLALKEVAAKVGQQYDITPFVSFEVSAAGEHKNCFTTSVPTIDYREKNYSVPVWEATEHIKNHGGIFAFNHPFAIGPLKKKVFSPVERMQILAKMLAELIANRAYGASLLEVGFPEGRNGFSLEEYVRLWDMLSVSGLFLTGYGCNDCHRDNTGWFAGNNFAAYIGVPAGLSHPIAEAWFVKAMEKGSVYTGDPVKLRGAVDFRTEGGHPMGSVFLSEDQEQVSILFSAENTRPGWRFRLMENGLDVYSEEITGDSYSHRSQLRLGATTVNFQRAELWDETGRCILLTNPIYLINTKLFAGTLPGQRIVKEETL